MNSIRAYFNEVFEASVAGWNRFWFEPADPATLAVIRICTGAMLLYTHLIWGLDLLGFFGADGRLPEMFSRAMNNSEFAWSPLFGMTSPTLLWTFHVTALACFACLMIGAWTRITAWASFLFAVAYANRAAGALFGLDQINVFLALYLAVGPAGDAYSWDRRRQRGAGRCPSIGANIALRLIQCHMCIVYLFAGLGKLLGPTWWEGTALWGAFANLEYQTLDMTWVCSHPMPVNFVTHLILVWEISYIALIWPRLTRPIMLALAIPLHLGIAICMGMITFGLIMLVGNFAFVPSWCVRQWLGERDVAGPT
ncbi:MAG: HTTM domain-containing protein [Planctomycetales bacterium]|nr:HTTM domain-containing protein [Planctomycetales bacterium]